MAEMSCGIPTTWWIDDTLHAMRGSKYFPKIDAKSRFFQLSLDDVIIYAEAMTELLKRIRKVLDRCRQYNLKLNRSNCEFGVKQITILGHVVSVEGIEPDVRGTLRGTQYRNTVRKNGKYRNAASKIV